VQDLEIAPGADLSGGFNDEAHLVMVLDIGPAAMQDIVNRRDLVEAEVGDAINDLINYWSSL
jgi:hypothetical protein